MLALLHLFGTFADQHGHAIQMIGIALVFVGVGFLICPFWLRFGGRA